MLPENDLIVFRRGMYATYGKKVRYYAETKLAARTKIPAPSMPPIRVDPTVAHNSLRVIAAAEAAGDDVAAPVVGVPQTSMRHLNQAAIAAAKAAPPGERTARLFEQLVTTENKGSLSAAA